MRIFRVTLGLLTGLLLLTIAVGSQVAINSPRSGVSILPMPFVNGAGLVRGDLLTATNVGTVNGATVTVVEGGTDVIHQTVFTLTATPLTLSNAAVGAGVKIYDFPAGVITILGASGSIAETTTSILADTLNTGVTYNWGVGTTTQANGALATTEQDIIPSSNGTASATINVAGAASLGPRTAAPVQFNGSTTATALFFNVGVATADDIDANATTTYTGVLTVTWIFNGDI